MQQLPVDGKEIHEAYMIYATNILFFLGLSLDSGSMNCKVFAMSERVGDGWGNW